MGKTKANIALSAKAEHEFEQLQHGLKKVSEKLIAETKKANGYLVVADKDGKVKKVAAKDL